MSQMTFWWHFLWFKKNGHGWWMSSFIGQNPIFSCQQLVMKYYNEWLKFGWKNHLGSDNNCNTINVWSPKKLQGITNNIGLTFSVGDTIPRYAISIEQDN